MERAAKALKDNVVAGVIILVVVVLTVTSTITMQRSFTNASRQDTEALIGYVRCLIQIPRDVDNRVKALDECAERAVRQEKLRDRQD